jgi:APA family basic amino acid/polyamine antiporter
VGRKPRFSQVPSRAEPVEVREVPLARALGLVHTVFLGVGTAIGGVLFAIMGRAVAVAGPGIIVTFLIGAVFAMFMGICYAELGAAVPAGAGGAISFVRRAYGERLPTFVAGWFDWIGSLTDCSIGALVFAFSTQYFLRWVEPFTLATLTLVFFALVNFRGAKAMGTVQFVVTAVLVMSLLLFMAGSVTTFEVQRLEPLFPNGFLPALFMVSYIFPTYAGYETITQLSEEVKIAGKTIPRALFLTLILIGVLFTGSALATVACAPREVYINSNTPLQDAANYFLGPVGGIIISVGSIVATLSTINGSMAGGTRIAFALGRSRLLPKVFSRVHPKHRSPYTALALTTLLAILFIWTRSIDFIVYAITLGYTVTAIMVALALIRLRKTEPHLYRPFKVPLYPVTPVLAIAFLVFMLLTLSPESIGLGLALGLIGLGLFRLTRKRWQAHEASNNGKSNAQNKADNTFK